PQRRLLADEYWRAGVFAAEHGLLAALRIGLGKPEPSRIRCDQSGSAGPGGAALEFEFSPGCLSGHPALRLAKPGGKSEEPDLFHPAAASTTQPSQGAQ